MQGELSSYKGLTALCLDPVFLVIFKIKAISIFFFLLFLQRSGTRADVIAQLPELHGIFKCIKYLYSVYKIPGTMLTFCKYFFETMVGL